MVIDAFCSSPWYVDHVRPIWLAIPPEHRGTFHVSHVAATAARGLPGLQVGRPTGNQRPTLTVSYGDYRAAKSVGRDYIALGQHGAGQSYSIPHRAYPGGEGQGGVSLFLVPNEHAAARTRKAYPRARVELVGCPKLDSLPRKERSGEPVVALSFHWDGPGIAPEMKSAWSWYQRALPDVGKRWKVLGHAHPRIVSKCGATYRRAGIEVVASFTDVLERADLYACDNSSSLFEFAATGRPVVVLNQPAFRRDVEHGLRFWEASGVGHNVSAPGDLASGIEYALGDPVEMQRERERALSLVYQPRTGGADLAAAALVDWAESIRPPVRVSRSRQTGVLYQRTRPRLTRTA